MLLKIMMLALATDQQVLALTLLGESRNQGRFGMEAVCSVICNRSQTRKMPLRKVCLAPKQFSCWNGKGVSPELLKSKEGKIALAIAKTAIDGKLKDRTGNATHYHTTAIHPPWAKSLKKTVRIKSHVFYKENKH